VCVTVAHTGKTHSPEEEERAPEHRASEAAAAVAAATMDARSPHSHLVANPQDVPPSPSPSPSAQNRIADPYSAHSLYLFPHRNAALDDALSSALHGGPAPLRNTVELNGVYVPSELVPDIAPPPVQEPCLSCKAAGSVRGTQRGLPCVTKCQVRMHNTLSDMWIVAGASVYDVSELIRLDQHPGGRRAFVRRAGGSVDCQEDFNFHSYDGRSLWAKYRVALLVSCDIDDEPASLCVIS